MGKIVFGTGVSHIVQRRDNRGRLIPVENREVVGLDIVKSISFEHSVDQKSVFGSRAYAEAVANGQQTVSGSIELAGDDLNFRALISGQTLTNGSTGVHWKYSTFVIPEGGVYTLIPEDNGTFASVISVISKKTAKKFKKVSGAPLKNQYSVTSAGVFTFNILDEDTEIYINYKYKSSVGKQLRFTNIEMGQGAECSLEIYFPKYGVLLTLCNVTFGGISANYTSDDFASYTLNFTCSIDEFDDVYFIDDNTETFE